VLDDEVWGGGKRVSFFNRLSLFLGDGMGCILQLKRYVSELVMYDMVITILPQ